MKHEKTKLPRQGKENHLGKGLGIGTAVAAGVTVAAAALVASIIDRGTISYGAMGKMAILILILASGCGQLYRAATGRFQKAGGVPADRRMLPGAAADSDGLCVWRNIQGTATRPGDRHGELCRSGAAVGRPERKTADKTPPDAVICSK